MGILQDDIGTGLPPHMVALLILAGVLLVLTITAGILEKRRGLAAWALIPWDYVMLLSAILLMVTLAYAAELWRRGG